MVEKEALGCFRNGSSSVHLGVLAAGLIVWPTAYLGTQVLPLGGEHVLIVNSVSAVATGSYYGIAYTLARGAPVWNLALPGLQVELGAGIVTTITGTAPLQPAGGWPGTLVAYLTVGAIVWLWHSRLEPNRSEWVHDNYPRAIVEQYSEAQHE